MKAGSSKVSVFLKNETAHEVQIPAKMILGEISACNVVSPIFGSISLLEMEEDEKKIQI